MQKIIIGIVAEMAAGKTTATDYLKEKYQAVSFRFSDPLRDILERLHLEHTRGNLQTLSTSLRQNFSEDILSKVLALDVKNSDNHIIITEGIRRPSDITYLKEIPGFCLISLEADQKIRFERITKRSENPDDQNKTWEEFVAEGNQESEQKIKEISNEAKFHINNNGTAEELYKQLDELITKLNNYES